MKYLVKFFVITFMLIASTYALADQKVAYIDMKFILNNSKAGKEAQEFLQKSFKDSQKLLGDKEKELKGEEKKLLEKKASLSKEEYKKNSENLRKKVIAYQGERRSALDVIAKKRQTARHQLLQKLDPILQKYISENNISLVIDKKNVVMGHTSEDITKVIVEILNKELPSLKLN